MTNPRLFDAKYRPPQFKPFALEDVFGDAGRPKALALKGYAARTRAKPEALQQALFSCLDAP